MNIVIASSEVAPYSKTGGLADVTEALPKELIKLGHHVKTFSPFYKCVSRKVSDIDNTGIEVTVKLGGREYVGEVLRKNDIYFIKNDEFYFYDDLYGNNDKEYENNSIRFAFFSLSVLEALRLMGERVDIINCHDWHTALIPIYMKLGYSDFRELGKTVSVFTIHNLAYQGLFSRETMKSINLPMELFNISGLEFYDKLSFIKGGLVFSDILTTVSKKYSHEIQSDPLGCGLDGVLRERKDDLFGILNGIDYENWDPQSDRLIASNYSPEDLSGKKICKENLKNIFNLPDKDNVPLIGMVSRLDPQKGFELIENAAKQIMKMPVQMVFLGTGLKRIEKFLRQLASKYPDKVGVHIGYDNMLAHKIEAGADIFLMPSRYEPCGLNHLYSLKYGTVPIVRATGGLDDTIKNYSKKRGKGNGFKFKGYSAQNLIKSVSKAVDLYDSDKKEWRQLQKRGMSEEHSWHKSAINYLKVYSRAIKKGPAKINDRERIINV